ncbi:hypothetical protein A2311_06040 [candidate division WOR-1 bacterium RIFOXYB2_FULL_48_7]|uniref:histidine kinase n=1 Tax=candidate division WOR-1 bacterium RIFOXYB2_FULL_48_7 TaxID=1802583 RepID=A0A1F4TQY7_UNCSA|nr:MAG: hypothetical protein A2311_06040 [candidate division WOR-1 bacterium RIFOXYB2_FULL_48_7]
MNLARLTPRKTVVYSLVTAAMTALFFILILVGQYYFTGLTGYSSLWVSGLIAFVVAFFFQPLRDLVQKFVDFIFFRSRYDYQNLLNKFSQAFGRPRSNLDKFSQVLPYLLHKSMNLSGISVMVLDRQLNQYVVRAGEGEGSTIIHKEISTKSALIEEMLFTKRELDRNHLASILQTDKTLRPELRARYQEIVQAMDDLKSALIIPCISESDYFNKPTLISTINMGRKLSDESYSIEDIEFLKTLANQAAATIEYTFIFEDLKKTTEQMIKNEKLAALGTTVAGIAHELKNPLSYLSIVAETLPQSWDNEKFRESVGKLFPSEVERMKLIIEGLSDYSKSHELRLEPTDLSTVLDKVAAILGYEFKKNNICLEKNYEQGDGERPFALADKHRIVQVFMNLINNAVQAIGPNGGTITLSAQITDKNVLIAIQDTGPGMSPELLNKIFDPFFTTKEQGTGLGLSITRKIVEEHKGSIDITSQVGQGTTFTILLPRP